MNKQLFAKLALIALGAGAAAAHAGLATSTFQVQMTITSSCSVTTAPTNINLGSVVAQTAAVTQTGNTTFKVNCSKSTPFFIGLSPSNNNTVGAGVMSGTGSNADKVPYTLYSDSGYSIAWGNTATSSSVGNGKSGTGAGMASGNAVSFTAYAKATSADFTPDTYTDTVTVNVNY
ncbi:spore coat protein U domain-containing protein [Polaromonas sp. C04]|uniref:Csu type fimbrial protein n=1 Tax=Polaromonas sp. C04 TaxID=1945857 RepID=UPI0009875819|nr:spore coat protein U domain-containing protein [Polaromonas sp. C04]OOG54790.1 hypothetical protein B0E49_08655 [Polaromonas sp. C04]